MPFTKPLERLEYFSNNSHPTDAALALAVLSQSVIVHFIFLERFSKLAEPETSYKSKWEISPIPTAARQWNFVRMKLNGGRLLEGAPGKSGMSLGICNACLRIL